MVHNIISQLSNKQVIRILSWIRKKLSEDASDASLSEEFALIGEEAIDYARCLLHLLAEVDTPIQSVLTTQLEKNASRFVRERLDEQENKGDLLTVVVLVAAAIVFLRKHPLVSIHIVYYTHLSEKEVEPKETQMRIEISQAALIKNSRAIGNKSKTVNGHNNIIIQIIDVNSKNMQKKEILFMAANPSGSTLRLDQEARDVEQHITRIAKYRDDFQFRKIVATSIGDLQQELLENPPHYLHFAGHGEKNGIYLNDFVGSYQLVRTKPLADLFSLYADKIECVFLNSCYSEEQALEINKHIPFVIGMSKAVADKVAIQFATSFYQAIAAGRDIPFAFRAAKNAIDLYGLKGSDIPVLHER